MDATAVVLVAVAVLVWGAFSSRLERADLTAPLVFVAVGALYAQVLEVLEPGEPGARLRLLAEVTLALVLFSDASRVRLRDLRSDAALDVRLLAVGLPLTIGAGWLLAYALFDGFDVWLALLVGAALAPTDAALGVAVITNRAVPARIRRLVNVESGLNDGIVTPVVAVALAGAATAEDLGEVGPGEAALELLVGAAAGVAVGAGAGLLIRRACRVGWADTAFAGPAVLAVAVLAYAGAVAVEGNGFVSAFVAGLLFGHATRREEEQEIAYVEQTGGLASLLVWLLFGAYVLDLTVEALSWQVVLYAVLSLTVVRMLPVALALLGAGLDRSTVAFVGWFGPRGLASIIFALLALEALDRDADEAVAVIAVTVLLSVVAHGVSAGPLGARYGAHVARRRMAAEMRPTEDMPVRGLPRRVTSAGTEDGRA